MNAGGEKGEKGEERQKGPLVVKLGIPSSLFCPFSPFQSPEEQYKLYLCNKTRITAIGFTKNSGFLVLGA